ncbi:hypothetical protein CAEBREN_13852 [Caenorhabditis brenneri]|uniref:Uncharacterized protein n=1 Tax=Caenorhabditis brenneri TaxID=135651 RepID=G0P7H2_CAEBE|nr:hypothetical protein CAEBREN_13852 [Caenorhabditis brenneri]
MAEGNELKRLRDEILGKEIECRNLREDLNDLRRKYLQVVFEKKSIVEAWENAAARIESISQEMYIAVGNNSNKPLVDI